MKTCPFCAEEIQDAAIICRYCGRELSPKAVAAINEAIVAGQLETASIEEAEVPKQIDEHRDIKQLRSYGNRLSGAIRARERPAHAIWIDVKSLHKELSSLVLSTKVLLVQKSGPELGGIMVGLLSGIDADGDIEALLDTAESELSDWELEIDAHNSHQPTSTPDYLKAIRPSKKPEHTNPAPLRASEIASETVGDGFWSKYSAFIILGALVALPIPFAGWVWLGIGLWRGYKAGWPAGVYGFLILLGIGIGLRALLGLLVVSTGFF